MKDILNSPWFFVAVVVVHALLLWLFGGDGGFSGVWMY